jgi:predicted ArsR family transcriptional regulator
MSDDIDNSVSGIAALNDPLRRALYRFVAAQDQAVSRDDAAAAVGVARPVAATHLDRLADCGLLDVEFRRLGGRQGPGAGRPSKLYRRAAHDIALSLPPRHYDLAADLLATAVRQATDTATPVGATLARVARDRGTELGHAARRRTGSRPRRSALVGAAVQVLTEEGYEPRMSDGDLVLANCPFHRLAADHTELICGMNLALLAGMAAALTDAGMVARLQPTPGWCCVRLRVDPSPENTPQARSWRADVGGEVETRAQTGDQAEKT